MGEKKIKKNKKDGRDGSDGKKMVKIGVERGEVYLDKEGRRMFSCREPGCEYFSQDSGKISKGTKPASMILTRHFTYAGLINANIRRRRLGMLEVIKLWFVILMWFITYVVLIDVILFNY